MHVAIPPIATWWWAGQRGWARWFIGKKPQQLLRIGLSVRTLVSMEEVYGPGLLQRMEKTQMEPRMRMQVPCVGGQHHQHKAAIDAGLLKVGTECALVREPANAYDKNAVKVLVSTSEGDSTLSILMIGYVKRNFAVDLAHHMDKGMKVSGRVALVRANSCMIDVEEVPDAPSQD